MFSGESEEVMRKSAELIDLLDEVGSFRFSSDWMRGYAKALIANCRFFLIVLVVSLFLALGAAMLLPAKYTATAVVGPPGPSPTNVMVAASGGGLLPGVGGSSGLAGVASKLLGGTTGSGSSDPYQEFLQILQSTRLQETLIERDHILPLIFHKKWDAQHGVWLPPTMLHIAKTWAMKLFNRPVSDAPGIEELAQYFEKNVIIASASATSRGMAGMLGGLSPYTSVSVTADDPKTAENLLSMILREADDLIRADERQEVSARLAYLRSQIPTVTVADEKQILVSILSSQEQLLMMIESDPRFASTMVDPPFSSNIPTFPKGPLVCAALAVAFAILVWTGLTYFACAGWSIARSLLKANLRILLNGE
jgi:hypothetical protein